MNCPLVFNGKQTRCPVCGRQYRGDRTLVRAECRITCPNLGQSIEHAGVTIKVKCGCNGREHERPHVAYECKLYNRCLPTLVPADMAVWKARIPESEIYHLCHGCDRGGELNNG